MSSETRNIVFIDSLVGDFSSLIDRLPQESEWYVLDSMHSGLAQMQSILARYSDLDSIHVISHGAPGTLYLGTSIVTFEALAENSLALAQIGRSLAESGDLLLYGCNVARGKDGSAFINSLALLTAADIQASTDETGAASLNGNSVLESQTGLIEVHSLNLDGLPSVLGVNRAPIFLNMNGRVVAVDPNIVNYTRVVIQQADQKMLVLNANSLLRFNADGSIDTTFAGEGAIPTTLLSSAFYVAVQPDSKILVVGNKGEGSRSDVGLLRYNSDGSLDGSFGAGGLVTTALGINDWGTNVAVQHDGRIVVAGQIYQNFDYYFASVRYESNGRLDTTFSGDGKEYTYLGSRTSNIVRSSAVQSDGKIIVAGSINGDFALLRYQADGGLDNTFGVNGVVTTYFSGISEDTGNVVALQPDGKIVLAGSSGKYFALARYSSSGVLDTSFSGDGKLTHQLVEDADNSVDEVRSITIQPDGKILAIGSHRNYADGRTDQDFALVRYNEDGSLDTTFGNRGVVLTDFGRDDVGYSVMLQPDGKLLVAGKRNFDFAFARFNADGSLDESFGNVSAIYKASGPAVIMDKDVRIYDPYHAENSYQYASLTLVRHGGSNANDKFSGSGIALGQAKGSVVVSNVVIGTYNYEHGALTIEFGRDATQSRVDRLLQSIAYSNSSSVPGVDAQIDWIFNDNNTGPQGSGGPLSTIGRTTVSFYSTQVGSDGLDVVAYQQARDQFSIKAFDSGWTVTGPGTSDRLLNIERVKFADQNVALDLSDAAGKVARLLGAVFGPASIHNKEYVGIGLYLMDQGTSYEDLATIAVRTSGKSTPNDVVELLWNNIVGVSIPAADKAYFVGMLDDGMSIGSLGTLAADTALNALNIDLVGLTQTGLEYVPFAG